MIELNSTVGIVTYYSNPAFMYHITHIGKAVLTTFFFKCWESRWIVNWEPLILIYKPECSWCIIIINDNRSHKIDKWLAGGSLCNAGQMWEHILQAVRKEGSISVLDSRTDGYAQHLGWSLITQIHLLAFCLNLTSHTEGSYSCMVFNYFSGLNSPLWHRAMHVFSQVRAPSWIWG